MRTTTTNICNALYNTKLYPNVMDTMAKRIADALQKKNEGNQSELARYVGVTPQAVQKWIAGDSEPKGKNLQKASEFLGVSQSYLRFGDTVPRPGNVIALHPDDPIPADMVVVKESKVHFSAGPGSQINYEIMEESQPATYKLSWFHQERINPDKVRRFSVRGDSQEPMLFDGDTVLVNLAETNVVDGKLYAIRYDNDLRIKFLSRRLDGTLILSSINPRHRTEEVAPELAEEHITIIGRVRDKSGKGGL